MPAFHGMTETIIAWVMVLIFMCFGLQQIPRKEDKQPTKSKSL